MRSQRAWTLQSFFLCFLGNGVLLAVLFFMARHAVSELYQWIVPFLTAEAAQLPQDLHRSLTSLEQSILQIQRFLPPVAFGLGAGLTLMLWLAVQFMGRRLLNRVRGEDGAALGGPPEVTVKEVGVSVTEPGVVQSSPQGAVQMLSILQRQGRLIDFLHEDLGLYDDSQIGAAVRNIHQGCKEALNEYLKLEPIFEAEEDNEIAVPTGFDSRAVRLTGDLKGGDPPFRGILRHRGWRVAHVQLPRSTMKQEEDWILAPAEVEVL